MKEVRITLSDDQVAAIEAEIAAGEARSIAEFVELALDAYLTPPDMPSREEMLPDGARGRGGGRGDGEWYTADEVLAACASRCAIDAARLRFRGCRPRRARRARYLADLRGQTSGSVATDLKLWLERLADGGAQLGTALGDDPAVRSFGYDGQATIVARFTPGEFDRPARLLHGTGLVARAGRSLTATSADASMIAKPFGCSVSVPSRAVLGAFCQRHRAGAGQADAMRLGRQVEDAEHGARRG